MVSTLVLTSLFLALGSRYGAHLNYTLVVDHLYRTLFVLVSEVERGVEIKPKTKYNCYLLYIFLCFSAKNTTLRKKSKDWMFRSRDN